MLTMVGHRHLSRVLYLLAICVVSVFFIADSFAESTIPKVPHSVKPLDLSRVPTTKELMAAGQLGGQLYPTEDTIIDDKLVGRSGTASGLSLLSKSDKDKKIKKLEEHNLSFGKAIQKWNEHEYKKAVKMFKKHAMDFPDSPWVDESLLHVGCDARYNGRYTEAEEMFATIMKNNQDSDHYGAKMLHNKARQRLAILKMLQGNRNEAIDHFSKVKQDSDDWRQRTYASHWIQRLSSYKNNELALLNCGTEALAHLLKKEGKEEQAREVQYMYPEDLKGHSVNDLKNIAERYGYNVKGLKIETSDLINIPLPAIVQISAKNEGDSGHYWVVEKVGNNELFLFDPQSGRRFSQTHDEFSQEWDGNTIVFSNGGSLPGVLLPENDMDTLYGGCCGVQEPESNLGSPSDSDKEGCGAPVWDVNLVNLNLYVTDTPLWYKPSIGPAVNIKLSYNSQSTIAYHEPFGNKWQFNFGSYLVIDTGGTVTIFMPDGRRDIYSPDGSGGFESPFKTYNVLSEIEPNHYELTFQDGTVYVYNIPPGTGSLQPFLLEIRDPYGQSLTFTYDANVQLTTITDATGKDSTLFYNAQGLVYQVTDPFGRSALFEYIGSNLTKITDMGGYWSSFDYDADIYLTKIEDPRGIWQFQTEPADGIVTVGNEYPAPGADMWENYRITVTNPAGDREEYMYHAGCSYGECFGKVFHVSARDYVHYESKTVNNFDTNVPKTRYHFTIRDMDYSQVGVYTGLVDAIFTPEGGYVRYSYNWDGTLWWIRDSDDNFRKFTYNNQGRVISMEDHKHIFTYYNYAPNGIDLTEIQNGLGTLKLTYNDKHAITSVEDLEGNITTYSYNTYGQLNKITDALGIETVLSYDADHRLEKVFKDGSEISGYTYDTIGRIDTATNALGLTLDYDFNDLNQLTKVTYPDAKFRTYAYSTCCPRIVDSMTDQLGRTTSYVYDEFKRLIRVTDPAKKFFDLKYDKNGNMIEFIDHDGVSTNFQYDLDNRIVRKEYTDGKFETYSYNELGYLEDKTTSRNVVTNYGYDINYNLETVTYSDGTPGITYTYDDYDRVDLRQDGIGTYDYQYDANSRLISVDGPWPNDTISYTYNKIGALKTMTPQSGQVITNYYDYDPENPGDTGLGRLKTIQSGSNQYTYNYAGISPQIQSLTRPNGSTTEYIYNDPLKRLTEITNKDSSQAVINSNVFAYNDLDLIGTETLTTGTALDAFTAGQKIYDYNNVNQLLNSTNPAETFIYDDDGNMTQGYTPDGFQFTATYDAENRLATLTYSDGANDYETRYFYNGDGMLAKVEKWDDTVAPGTLAKMDEVRFVRAGFLAIQERDSSDNVTREYTWGPNMGGGIGGLLNLNQGGTDYSYLYDGKGNVMALLNGLNVDASYKYDVFGKLLKKGGSFDQPFRFSTKRYDEATGLSYYGYRFYSPTIGRWVTRDPLGEAGGINLYGFVGNNPANFVDPYGLWLEGDHDDIIDKAFGGLRSSYRDAIKRGSVIADTYQSPAYSFMHHMRDGTRDQTREEARTLMNNYIQEHLFNYRLNLARGNYKIAYCELGMALHPIMDSTSPAHGNFNRWRGTIPLLFSAPHGLREFFVNINEEQTKDTINKMYDVLSR